MCGLSHRRRRHDSDLGRSIGRTTFAARNQFIGCRGRWCHGSGAARRHVANAVNRSACGARRAPAQRDRVTGVDARRRRADRSRGRCRWRWRWCGRRRRLFLFATSDGNQGDKQDYRGENSNSSIQCWLLSRFLAMQSFLCLGSDCVLRCTGRANYIVRNALFVSPCFHLHCPHELKLRVPRSLPPRWFGNRLIDNYDSSTT